MKPSLSLTTLTSIGGHPEQYTMLIDFQKNEEL